MIKPTETISLYLTEGRSDKEYHAEIIETGSGHVVNFRYGRRGGTLVVGTKTAVPITFKDAKSIFDKLIKEKLSKGYTPNQSSACYQDTEHAGSITDFAPQLLNPLTEVEAKTLIHDPQWAAQEKMDGERRAAHAENGQVIGMNRKGLVVPLPQAVANELQTLAAQHGTLRIDGEMVGDTLHAFDLLIYQDNSIHTFPWLKRMRLIQILLVQCNWIIPVPVAVTTAEKQRLWSNVQSARGEGIVFKQHNSPVTPGRPNSGGDWLKFKFTASASCLVTGINAGKRSIKIGLLNQAAPAQLPIAERMTAVGNVTIPPNHLIPAVGDIVEVQYLYAYPGGSLYQPVYHGQRYDMDLIACTLDQLKYKAEECTELAGALD